MSALPEPAGNRDRRTEALARRAAGDRVGALALFQEAGDSWSRNDAALECLHLDRVDEAKGIIEALLRDAPSFAPAHRTLGLLARREMRHEAALRHFETAAALAPQDLWSRQDMATELRALGRTAEVEATLRAMAAATPLPHAVRDLGRAARERGDGDAALAAFRVAAELLPADPWFQLDMAETLVELGRSDEATRTLERLSERAPGFAGAPRLLARLARQRNDAADEIRHRRRVAEIDPSNGPLDLAETLLRSGGREEAETLAARHLVRHPGDARALGLLAQAAREAGDGERALAHLEAAWAKGRGPSRAGLDWAAGLRGAGRVAEAEALYRRLAERDEVAADALVELALLERRADGIEVAFERLRAALDVTPDHPRAWLCLGDLLRETGELDKADAAYASALAARPGFGWALAGRAQVAEARGQPDEADRFWGEAIGAEPRDDWFAIAFAARLRDRGRFPDALNILRSIPDHSPRAAEAALAQGLVERARGDTRAALASFEAVARRWPEQAEGWIEASEDALRLGQEERALELLASGAAVSPGHVAFAEAQARLALARDDLGTAATLLAQAEATDPGRLWPRVAGARLAALMGRPADARERFAAIQRRFGLRAEVEIAKAEIDRQCGRPERAEARLRAARRRFPAHGAVGAQAVLAAVEAGQLDRAQTLLTELPAATLFERGRRHFAAAQLAAARWDFAAAIREGEAAVQLLPHDGWIRNRLAHAALLSLDLDRAAEILIDLAQLEAGTNALRGRSANPSQSHYGQLLDEFRLDADALAVLREAMRRPPAERLAAVDATVRRFPDATAPAVLRFIEARRSGALPTDLGTRDGGIPQAIHQFWTDPEPPADVAAYIESWRRRNPGFTHRLWSDTSARRYIADHAPPETGLAFDRAREPAMRADLFRLVLLSREGGVWADADDRCRRSIAPLLARGAGLVAYQEDLGSLGNNWLAARPDHPILVEALHRAVSAVNRGDGDILWLSTGPGLLTRVAAAAVAGDEAKGSDLLVLDRSDFLGFVAIHCLAAYKSTERHWSRTAFGGRRRTRR